MRPAEVTLRDGRIVTIREMRPDDEDRLVDFHGRLSPETIYLRFFSAHPRLLPAEVVRFTHVDNHDRVALVAMEGGREDDQRIVAVGRYDRLPGVPEAEVAFVVADDYQSQGLGRELLVRLAPIAREEGITRLVAETLVGNQRMLRVFRSSGLPITTRLVGGVVHVTLGLEERGREQLSG